MNELNDATLLVRLRAQWKRVEQLSWTIKELQERFPLGTPENEKHLLDTYLALRLDLKDIYEEIEKLRRVYGNDKD